MIKIDYSKMPYEIQKAAARQMFSEYEKVMSDICSGQKEGKACGIVIVKHYDKDDFTADIVGNMETVCNALVSALLTHINNECNLSEESKSTLLTSCALRIIEELNSYELGKAAEAYKDILLWALEQEQENDSEEY